MNKWLKVAVVTLALVFCFSGNVMAISFSGLNPGKEITSNDTIWNSDYSGGSKALGLAGEDNETEKLADGRSTYTGQKWDFEGMFWNSSTKALTIIAGWNFQTGVPHSGSFVQAGDFFIGSWGSTDYAHGKSFVSEEALVFSRKGNALEAKGTYKMVAGGFKVLNTTDVTPLSDPWRYKEGGAIEANSLFLYETGEIDDKTGMPFEGWKDSDVAGNPFDDHHYYLQIFGLDDSDIDGYILHMTLQCGNDVGRGTYNAPEPATIMLLGLGVVGIAGARRFKKI
jgi:hypothetical protein